MTKSKKTLRGESSERREVEAAARPWREAAIEWIKSIRLAPHLCVEGERATLRQGWRDGGASWPSPRAQLPGFRWSPGEKTQWAAPASHLRQRSLDLAAVATGDGKLALLELANLLNEQDSDHAGPTQEQVLAYESAELLVTVMEQTVGRSRPERLVTDSPAALPTNNTSAYAASPSSTAAPWNPRDSFHRSVLQIVDSLEAVGAAVRSELPLDASLRLLDGVIRGPSGVERGDPETIGRLKVAVGRLRSSLATTDDVRNAHRGIGSLFFRGRGGHRLWANIISGSWHNVAIGAANAMLEPADATSNRSDTIRHSVAAACVDPKAMSWLREELTREYASASLLPIPPPRAPTGITAALDAVAMWRLLADGLRRVLVVMPAHGDKPRRLFLQLAELEPPPEQGTPLTNMVQVDPFPSARDLLVHAHSVGTAVFAGLSERLADATDQLAGEVERFGLDSTPAIELARALRAKGGCRTLETFDLVTVVELLAGRLSLRLEAGDTPHEKHGPPSNQRQHRPRHAKKKRKRAPELSDSALLVLRALPSSKQEAVATQADVARRVDVAPRISVATVCRAIKALRAHKPELADAASYRRTKAGDAYVARH